MLERIIGRLIDINYHVLKEKHNVLPKDYFESFVKMAEVDEVEEQLTKALAQSVGLRNILAHEYDAVDPAKIHAAIPLALIQIPQYLIQISEKL